jgi:methyltransferase (TIGR00027 family)
MRALHSRSDPAPLLNDPWGDRLVPEAARAAFRERALAQLAPPLHGDVLDAALRASAAYPDVILRSRYTEDALQAAVVRGVSQYVIVGAGFDSFVCRRPAWAKELTIYEIDHPDTQQLKRHRLQACGVAESTSVHFIEADLSMESLATALARSPFDATSPAFFSWLGVTVYLPREANLAALRAIASSTSSAASELVFTYIDESVLEGRHADANTEAFRKLRSDVSTAGEAFLSGFDPTNLEALLMESGLQLIEDLDGHQSVARYDPKGLNGLKPAGAAHIARARVMRA